MSDYLDKIIGRTAIMNNKEYSITLITFNMYGQPIFNLTDNDGNVVITEQFTRPGVLAFEVLS